MRRQAEAGHDGERSDRVGRRKGVVTAPHKAVKREGKRKFVFVFNNGTLEKRFVKVGLRDRSYVEIMDGLKEGELVVMGEPLRK